MIELTKEELSNIKGGSLREIYNYFCKVYRTIKIKRLMNKLFID